MANAAMAILCFRLKAFNGSGLFLFPAGEGEARDS
jgi:hypothetical protein